jgi:hypothetical protein
LHNWRRYDQKGDGSGCGEEEEELEMSHRAVAQMSLADELVARRAGQNEQLGKIDRLMQWKPLERMLKRI